MNDHKNDEEITDNNSVQEDNSTVKEKETLSLDEDDSAVLAGDDSQIFKDKYMSIFQQENNIVTWSIENLYTDKGKMRSKSSLRRKPPLLKIESNDGSYVEFLMTKELSASLEDVTRKIRKAYYGIEEDDQYVSFFSKKGFMKWFNNVKTKILKNKVKSIILAIIVLGFILIPLIFH